MNRLFKYAMFFTAFIPLWITILFLDIMYNGSVVKTKI